MWYSFFLAIPRRLNFMCRRFGTLSVPSAQVVTPKMETECSETSAHKIQTPGNHAKERKQLSKHGESLKSRITVKMFVSHGRTDIYGGFTHSVPCPCCPMPCVNSHMPCRSPALLRQCRVLRESPRGSRKYPNC